MVHFWALIFTYMWAGPHHLHYTALPDWTQSIGMLFSLVLLAPSWGGMINGIMTLSGAWHKLRDDPILKFRVTSLSFYGMSTFEGPMMSIKTVNALSHTPTGRWAMCTPARFGLGGVRVHRRDHYMIPRLVKKMHSIQADRKSTSGSPRSASCSTSPRCGSRASCRGLMARGERRRHR